GPRHWRARLARARREKWLAQLVEEVRSGAVRAPAGSAVEAVATCRDYTGQVLSPRTAAVELLNVVRPTAAVSWFVAFTAHALHRWPVHRERLRDASAEHAIAFAHEVRRFYPFAPFAGGLAAGELTWRGEPLPPGALVLLDLYGQNHDHTCGSSRTGSPPTGAPPRPRGATSWWRREGLIRAPATGARARTSPPRCWPRW